MSVVSNCNQNASGNRELAGPRPCPLPIDREVIPEEMRHSSPIPTATLWAKSISDCRMDS